MTIKGQSSDRISTLPQPIIEYILTLIPVQDAVRTSTLSTKWRYCWRGMPKLVFTDDMAVAPSPRDCECDLDMSPFVCVCRRQLINAILHVLLFHKGPTSVEISCSLAGLDIDFRFIVRHLSSMADTVKEFIFLMKEHCIPGYCYDLCPSFFDLHRLEYIHLESCYFKTPSTFNGFKRLRTMVFYNVRLDADSFLLFLSKCPLLEKLILDGSEYNPEYEFYFGGVNESTLVDLLRCVPAIKTLNISDSYMKCLCIGGMPHKLPTSLFHLKQLYLHVCLTERNDVLAALCIIRSSPALEEINFVVYDYDETLSPDRLTPANLFDPVNNSDLKLDHVVFWKIKRYNNLPLELEFVKLIMAKSPVLKTLQIEHNGILSDDEKLKMHTNLMSLPRASPSAELIIEMKSKVVFYPWDWNGWNAD